MSKELQIINFSEEQVKLIKSQIAPKATDAELQLFLYQAKRTGLDPLTRQIYAIHRNVKEKEYGQDVWKAKMTIQTSIDGFRVIAERSGDYGGQDEPVFDESDGLKSCKITVYRFRGDVRYPAAVGVAHWSEYNQDNTMWKKMPRTMLAKVAEALALRKAYPQDISGLYTNDEMAQADLVDKTPEPKNQFSGLAQVADEDMKATQQKGNQDEARSVANLIKNAKSLEDIDLIWESSSKIINKLKKYDLDSLAKLTTYKDKIVKEFEQAARMKADLGDQE